MTDTEMGEKWCPMINDRCKGSICMAAKELVQDAVETSEWLEWKRKLSAVHRNTGSTVAMNEFMYDRMLADWEEQYPEPEKYIKSEPTYACSVYA